MYGEYLYRLNYEKYMEVEAEIDTKLMKLAEEGDNEDSIPLDEAYIIQFDTTNKEDFHVKTSGYFVLLIGDHNFDEAYAEKVICSLDDSYVRYLEIKKVDRNTGDDKFARDLLREFLRLQDYFCVCDPMETPEVTDEILEGTADYGKVIKKLF